MVLRDVDGVDIPEEDWTREQLIQYIKDHVIGDGTKEPKSPIDKYGYRGWGICDCWFWNTVSPRLKDATDDELWKIIAINNTFWLHKYQKWYHENVLKKCLKS